MHRLTLFLIILLTSHLSYAQVTEADSLALVAFYNGLDGPNWTNQANWLNGPVGTWEGITVNNGRVTNINIVSNGLNGDLPDEFYLLTGLTTFNLLNNNITGPLKDDIVNLTECTNLGFQGCKLSGTFPNAVGQMTQLSSLSFSSNNFSGPLPDSIGNLPNLSIIFFQFNQFEGPLPESWTGMPNLSTLALSQNQLTGTLDVLGTMPRLRNLTLNENNWDEQPFPAWLDDMEEILTFSCYDCNLVGEIPDIDLTDNADFSSMTLGENNLSGDISRLFGPEEGFFAYSLDVAGNNFGGTLEITGLGNVSRITVDDNCFDSIGQISVLDLNALFMRENKFTFEDFVSLKEIQDSDTVALQLSPQDSLLSPGTVMIKAGETLTLEAGTTQEWNNYTWYQDGGIVSGQNEATLQIANADEDASGVYYCRITNDSITNVFLYRHPVTVVVDGTSSAIDIATTEDLMVYPNPAHEQLYVKLNADVDVREYRITSMLGHIVSQGQLNGSQPISLTTIATGTYGIQLFGPDVTYSGMVIKK